MSGLTMPSDYESLPSDLPLAGTKLPAVWHGINPRLQEQEAAGQVPTRAQFRLDPKYMVANEAERHGS